MSPKTFFQARGAGSSPGPLPLFTDLSKTDDDVIRHYYLQHANTPRHSLMDLWLLKHDLDVYYASNGDMVVAYGPRKVPIAEGVVTSKDIDQTDLAVSQEIGRALFDQETSQQYRECVRAWSRRGGVVTERRNWTGILEIDARNGTSRVVGMEIPPEHWPSELDGELRDCVVSSYIGHEWEASKDYRYRLQVGGCVLPATTARKE